MFTNRGKVTMITLNEIHCIADISRYQSRKNSKRIAHIFEGRETSYRELDRIASQVANGLISAKCSPNTRVGFIGKNSDYFFEVLIGAAKANVVTTPVNWRLAPPEIEYILNNAEVEVLFVGAEFYETIQQIAANITSIDKIIAIDGGHKEWENYVDWRDSQDDTDPMLSIELNDDVVQMYTSGTTGHPKGVQLTNGNYLDAANQGALGGAGDWQEGETCMVAMPVFHVAGLNTALMGLLQGVANIIIKDVDPMVILDSLEKYRVKYTLFVPAVILFLNSIPGIRERDFSNFDIMMYGGSPISEDVLLTAKEIFNCDFYQIYGLTETCGQGAMLGPEDHDPARGKLRSCGKPAPTSEFRIIGDNGEDLAANVVGEILYRSGSLMKGYWKNDVSTAKSIQGSWFYTGDAGYLDDEGYLFIHDRIKDMIVTGGENVYPAEVENALFSHEAIADVAVIGVPNKKWGESVKAIVVLKPGITSSEEDIITYAKSKIASYKVPKSIDFAEVLPRNPSGKLLKRELRAPYWKDQERQVG
jgi:acyl-CoA synthetase (AMP-forming)/AMP-acid ligase II